jgi:hypothetical protein
MGYSLSNNHKTFIGKKQGKGKKNLTPIAGEVPWGFALS